MTGYKRIAAIGNEEDAGDMLEELIDRFGEPPRCVQDLIRAALIKAMMHRAYVTEIRQGQDEIRIALHDRAGLDPAGIPGLLEMPEWRNRLFFRAVPEPYFMLRSTAKVKRQKELLDTLQKLAEDLQKLCTDTEDGTYGT